MSTFNILKRRDTGITLIALVITIVVVLILAGITISAMGGNNGLLKQIKSEKTNIETKSDIVENEIKELEDNLNQDSPIIVVTQEIGTNYIRLKNVGVVNSRDTVDEYNYYIKKSSENTDKYQQISTQEIHQVYITGLIHNNAYDIKIVAKSGGNTVITRTMNLKTQELLCSDLKFTTSNNENYLAGKWTNKDVNVSLVKKEGATSTYASVAGSAQTISSTQDNKIVNINGITKLEVTTTDGTNTVNKQYEVRIDKEAPIIKITPSGLTNQYPEVLTISVTEGTTSIKSLTLPNGTVVSGDGKKTIQTTYNTTINGPVECTSVDELGNTRTTQYEVTNVASLETEWTITADNTTITVPLTGTVKAYIDYGDGTKQSVASQNPTHTYAKAGTYTMRISGNCTKIESNADMKKYITKLENWGCLNTTVYKFNGCTKMAGTIPTPHAKSFVNLTSVDSLFKDCSSLTGNIPSDLFKYCTGMTTFSNTFDGCSGLTSIPESLFANCTGVTSFDYTFNGCKGLTSIPAGLFKNSTGVTRFKSTFDECSGLTSIPAGLFENCTKVTSFDYTFDGCGGLTSIPAGLFNKNTNVTKFDHTFAWCDGITSIPSTLFAKNTKVTDFVAIFLQCDGITSIPESLFANCPEVLIFEDVFAYCVSITGEIPANLFANNKKVTNFDGIFAWCKLITKIPSTLFKNNTEVLSFNDTFSFMTGLKATLNSTTKKQEQIPTGLFDNCTKVKNFNYTFEYSRLTCAPPSTLFANCPEVTEFRSTFLVNNFTTIPAALFSKNTKVTDFRRSLSRLFGVEINTFYFIC